VMGVLCILYMQSPSHDRLDNHRTWQDGLVISKRWQYTNILVRLQRGFVTFLRVLNPSHSLFVIRSSPELYTTPTSDREPSSESRIQSFVNLFIFKCTTCATNRVLSGGCRDRFEFFPSSPRWLAVNLFLRNPSSITITRSSAATGAGLGMLSSMIRIEYYNLI
jgi:hypothetical protein